MTFSPSLQSSLLVGAALLLSVASALRSGPANGDLRLAYSNGSRYHGVLYIFLDGEWGSVSYQGFTKSAADVACRQLGQVRADNFTATGVNNTDLIPDDEFGSGTSPVLLKDVHCRSNRSLHLLRCNSTTSMSHDHTNDVLLYCSQQNLTDEPHRYRGQLRLTGGNYTSQGLLHVFLNDRWGTVCGEQFRQPEADSACRQLGYTGAENLTNHRFGRGIIWIKDFYCNESQPCLRECYTPPTVRDITCRHTQDVYLYCTFDRALLLFDTSGNETECKIVITEVPRWITILFFTLFLTIGLGYIIIIVVRSFNAAYHNTSRYRRQNTQNAQQGETHNLIT